MSSNSKCRDHNRYVCVECGHNTCIHRKNQYSCKICNPHLTCDHNKNKNSCIICSPEKFCVHKRQSYNCKDCGGPGICKHGKRKIVCKVCGGKSICKHGNDKYRCKDCRGPGICDHGIQKSLCTDCKGGGTCEHEKVRRSCKICSIKKSATAQQQMEEQMEQQEEQQGHEAILDQGDIERFDAYMQQSIQDPITFPDIFDPANAEEVANQIERAAGNIHFQQTGELPTDEMRTNFIADILQKIPYYVDYKRQQTQTPLLPPFPAAAAPPFPTFATHFEMPTSATTGAAPPPFLAAAPASPGFAPAAAPPFPAAADDPAFAPPDYNPYENFFADDIGGSTGKRKRRRFTRRLPRKYNHTKKKSKFAKRKLTKRLRKNKI